MLEGLKELVKARGPMTPEERANVKPMGMPSPGQEFHPPGRPTTEMTPEQLQEAIDEMTGNLKGLSAELMKSMSRQEAMATAAMQGMIEAHKALLRRRGPVDRSKIKPMPMPTKDVDRIWLNEQILIVGEQLKAKKEELKSQ